MGIFNELEKVLAKTGDVIGTVAHELGSKTTGWGEKADGWLDGTLDKIKESVQKEETAPTNTSTENVTDIPVNISTEVQEKTVTPAPKPRPAPERQPSGSK